MKLIIPDQNTNLGMLFRTFIIGILIYILKAKWVSPKAIFMFRFSRTYIFIIWTYEADVCSVI